MGPEGPEGPAGDDGDDGEDGKDGKDGDKGDQGDPGEVDTEKLKLLVIFLINEMNDSMKEEILAELIPRIENMEEKTISLEIFQDGRSLGLSTTPEFKSPGNRVVKFDVEQVVKSPADTVTPLGGE